MEASGETLIESKGQMHRIVFEMDPVQADSQGFCGRLLSSDVQIGTRITVKWPAKACYLLEDARDRFAQIAGGFATFNPHVALHARWDDEESLTCRRVRSRGTSGEHGTRRPPTGTMWSNSSATLRRTLLGTKITGKPGAPCAIHQRTARAKPKWQAESCARGDRNVWRHALCILRWR